MCFTLVDNSYAFSPLCSPRVQGTLSIWLNRRRSTLPLLQPRLAQSAHCSQSASSMVVLIATAPSPPFRLIHPPGLLSPLGTARLLHQSHCSLRQPPPPRFIPPSGSIVALLTTIRIAPFRQPPPHRPFLPLAGVVFRSHRRRFGYGALVASRGIWGAPEPACP